MPGQQQQRQPAPHLIGSSRVTSLKVLPTLLPPRPLLLPPPPPRTPRPGRRLPWCPCRLLPQLLDQLQAQAAPRALIAVHSGAQEHQVRPQHALDHRQGMAAASSITSSSAWVSRLACCGWMYCTVCDQHRSHSTHTAASDVARSVTARSISRNCSCDHGPIPMFRRV